MSGYVVCVCVCVLSYFRSGGFSFHFCFQFPYAFLFRLFCFYARLLRLDGAIRHAATKKAFTELFFFPSYRVLWNPLWLFSVGSWMEWVIPGFNEFFGNVDWGLKTGLLRFFLPSSTEFNPIRIKVYWLQTMHPSKKVIFPSFNLVSIKTIKRKELEWNDWSTTGPILGYVLPIKFVAESRMEFLKSTNHVTVRILVFQTFPLEECRSSGGGHRILLFRFCFLSFFFLRLCLKKLSWKNRENQRKLRRDPVRSLQYRLRRIDYESHWWMALHGVIHQPRICNSKERGRFFICFLFDSFLCV